MSLFSGIGNYLKGLGLGLFGKLESSIEQFLQQFIENDLGKLAVASAQWAEDSLPGAADSVKREAAKNNFITAAKAAGKDLGAFSESLLNFVIEAAVQIIQAKLGTVTGTLTEDIEQVPVPPSTTSTNSVNPAVVQTNVKK